MSNKRMNKDTAEAEVKGAAESVDEVKATESTEKADKSGADKSEGGKAKAGKSEEAASKATKKMVYVGPSVRGVARQYTVFNGDIPVMLDEFMAEHPTARALLIPADRLAEARRNLETAGTAEALLYNKIKSEL